MNGSDLDDAPENARRKRLYFRSLRRGFKEVDLVFGTFARDRLAGLNAAELDAYEALLEAPDQDVWLWLQGMSEAPPSYQTSILEQLKALCQRQSPDWIR
ncbi:MAG: succinate dehydrogenase assembly factor 2 [Rhizomicrobium sp.]